MNFLPSSSATPLPNPLLQARLILSSRALTFPPIPKSAYPALHALYFSSLHTDQPYTNLKKGLLEPRWRELGVTEDEVWAIGVIVEEGSRSDMISSGSGGATGGHNADESLESPILAAQGQASSPGTPVIRPELTVWIVDRSYHLSVPLPTPKSLPTFLQNPSVASGNATFQRPVQSTRPRSSWPPHSGVRFRNQSRS